MKRPWTRNARRHDERSARHWNAGDLDAASAAAEEALRLDPANVDALAHSGTLRWLQGDRAAARRLYLEAHARAPGHIGVLLNLATLDGEAGDVEASMAWIERAEALRPDDRRVVWRKSLLELALGDYANGWRHYEAGLFDASIRGLGPGFAAPPWDGGPCDRLLLWHEQGFGDTIQFVRYAERCRERAKRVVVLCPRELTALLRGCPFVDDAVDAIGVDDFDRHVPLMSLPHRFGTTLDTVPAPVPYLFADPARRARCAGRSPDDALQVGLVWAGGERREARFRLLDAGRNLSLRAMRPLLDVADVAGVAFLSLQTGAARGEIDDARIVDAMVGVTDFADTAAVVDGLDLVITVDTAVAHLAGAMGKPVWILSRLDACWRWLRNRSDSPWYPTARVFGQPSQGDWHDVVERVARELAALAAKRGAG